MTSSPFPKPNALKAISNAKVPFAKDTAYFESDHAANSFSNFRHSLPVQ